MKMNRKTLFRTLGILLMLLTACGEAKDSNSSTKHSIRLPNVDPFVSQKETAASSQTPSDTPKKNLEREAFLDCRVAMQSQNAVSVQSASNSFDSEFDRTFASDSSEKTTQRKGKAKRTEGKDSIALTGIADESENLKGSFENSGKYDLTDISVTTQDTADSDPVTSVKEDYHGMVSSAAYYDGDGYLYRNLSGLSDIINQYTGTSITTPKVKVAVSEPGKASGSRTREEIDKDLTDFEDNLSSEVQYKTEEDGSYSRSYNFTITDAEKNNLDLILDTVNLKLKIGYTKSYVTSYSLEGQRKVNYDKKKLTALIGARPDSDQKTQIQNLRNRIPMQKRNFTFRDRKRNYSLSYTGVQVKTLGRLEKLGYIELKNNF